MGLPRLGLLSIYPSLPKATRFCIFPGQGLWGHLMIMRRGLKEGIKTRFAKVTFLETSLCRCSFRKMPVLGGHSHSSFVDIPASGLTLLQTFPHTAARGIFLKNPFANVTLLGNSQGSLPPGLNPTFGSSSHHFSQFPQSSATLGVYQFPKHRRYFYAPVPLHTLPGIPFSLSSIKTTPIYSYYFEYFASRL